MKKFLFFLFLFSFIVSVSVSARVPTVLTYGLPEDNPDMTIERRGLFDLFAIFPTKNEYTISELPVIVSKDLVHWNSVCDDTRLVVDIYKDNDFLFGDFTPVGKLIGSEAIGEVKTTINTFLGVGNYGVAHYLWCADTFSRFLVNNNCPSFPNSGLCKLYFDGEHRISNVEDTGFIVVDDTQPPPPPPPPPSCTNEDGCQSQNMRCSGNTLQICGDFDADSCLEYATDGSGTTCSEGCESCGSGCAKCKTTTTTTTTTIPSEEPQAYGLTWELDNLEIPSTMKWDSQGAAFLVEVFNKNDDTKKAKVEAVYVSRTSDYYKTIEPELQFQSVFTPRGGIELFSCPTSEDFKQQVEVTVEKGKSVTIIFSPDLPSSSSLFKSKFNDGSSNFNENGDYAIIVGVFEECGKGHISNVLAKKVTLKTDFDVPDKEVCTIERKDSDQDGFLPENDADCGNIEPLTPDTKTIEKQTALTAEEIKKATPEQFANSLCNLYSDCDNNNCVSQKFLENEGILTEASFGEKLEKFVDDKFSLKGIFIGVGNFFNLDDLGRAVGIIEKEKLGLCFDEEKGDGEFDFNQISPCVWGESIWKDNGCLAGWGIVIFILLILFMPRK